MEFAQIAFMEMGNQSLVVDDEEHSVQYKEYLENSSNAIVASNFNQEKEEPPQDSDIRHLLEKNEVKHIVEQPNKHGTRITESLQNFRVKKSSTSLNNTSQISSIHAIAPVLPTEEPEYSLSMGEYEVTSDDESECDMPVKDESSPVFTTFSNPIFNDNDDFTSSDDESLSNEDVPMEDFKVYSNPLFDDEEINSDKLDLHCFNAESDLIKSLSNRDTLIDSSLKFNYIEDFSDELMPTSIVNEECIRREHEEYISLMEKWFTINSFPRPLENFHANMIVETLPSSTIPVGDGDSQREEISIFTSTNDLLPPGIESNDYDSTGDIHFLKELLSHDSILLPKNESSNFDHHEDSSFPRPPPEPPDVEFFFEPNLGELISVVINNIDELYEDECFDPGGEIDVFENVEDDDYFPFIFLIQIFLLIYPTMIEDSRVRYVVPVHLRYGFSKNTKKWPKPDKIKHEIAKNAQNPDSKTFFVHKSNQQVKKSCKKAKIAKSGTYSAN
nr:hypothetical protein [Tanacetum cinerariifolium]